MPWSNRARTSQFLLFLIVFQFGFVEICLIRGELLDQNNALEFSPPDSKIELSISNSSEKDIFKVRINPSLIRLSKISELEQEINVIIQSEPQKLEVSMGDFKSYGEIIDILDLTHFSGFTARIKNKNLIHLLENLPESIQLVEENGKAELTLKNTLEQLRIFPYIRKDYSFKGDVNTSIAILDSGVDATHPAFKDKIIHWEDFGPINYSTGTDYRAHGTAVSSIACGNPYNTTDENDRTVISSKVYYDWTGFGFNFSERYAYSTNTVKANRNGTLKIEGNWFIELASTAIVDSYRILNSSNYVVAEVKTPNENQNYTLTYEINETNYGSYTIQPTFNVSSSTYPAYGINITIYLPENNSEIETSYSGVAPNCKLVALRCILEADGDDSRVISALNWILSNHKTYNITAVVMSFRLNNIAVRYLADDLVEAGITVSCAGGNSGPGGNYAGASYMNPSNADKVISVGATNYNSSITSYSSQGGLGPSGQTMKPDIVAPGGTIGSTYNNSVIYAADSNFAEFFGSPSIVPSSYQNITDVSVNDTRGVQGTSFAAPFVAGVSQLIIEALGGRENWNYTEQEALFVKNLLLLTATETYPNRRLYPEDGEEDLYNPLLNRGDKDVHEGYGKINPDAAIDAIMNQMAINTTFYNQSLYSIPTNDESKPYCWARKIYLPRDFYNITLQVPQNADFDLFIYEYQGNQYGEPTYQLRRINETLGEDEVAIDWFPPSDNYYFVVVKGVNGSGMFNLSFYKSPTHFDKINPLCNILQPSNYTTHNETIEFKGNATDDYSGIKLVTFIITSPTRQVSFVLPNPTGNFSIEWISKKIDNGLTSIYIIAEDNFNNTAISETLYITIFNDDIPPVFEWFLPEDLSIIEGPLHCKIRIYDLHHEVNNVSIFITTPSRTIRIDIPEIQEIIEYTWTPFVQDDGTCLLYFQAYDNKDNVGKSKTLLLVIRTGEMMTNIMLFTMVITILGLYVGNKIAKKVLTNDKIMRYIEEVQEFIKKPSMKDIAKVSPLFLVRKERVSLSRINEINNLIGQGAFEKALSLCDYLLSVIERQPKREASGELFKMLTDIKSDLLKRI